MRDVMQRAAAAAAIVLMALLAGCSGDRGGAAAVSSDEQPGAAEVASGVPGAASSRGDVGAWGSVLANPGSVTGDIGKARELWRRDVGVPPSGSPVVVGAAVVAGFADSTVRALRSHDGEELWRWAHDVLPLAITARAETVYVSGSNTTVCLDAEGGEQIWRAPYGVVAGCRIITTSRAVYLPDGDCTLTALDPQSGDLLWTTQLGATARTTGASALPVGLAVLPDGALVVVLSDGRIEARDGESGAEIWTAQLDHGVSASPAVTTDGVYLAGVTGDVHRVDPSTGDLGLICSVPDWVLAEPVGDGDSIIVCGASGRVYLSSASASRSVTDPAPAFSAGTDLAGQPALYDSVLLLSDAQGLLHGLDRSTGRRLWSVDLGVRQSGAMASDGSTIFVVGAAGTIVAFAVDDALDSAPLLSASRVHRVPEDGRFRMQDRYVQFLYEPAVAGETTFSVLSEDPEDELTLMIREASGGLLACTTEVMQVEQMLRLPVLAGRQYTVHVERPYSDPVVSLALQIIQ